MRNLGNTLIKILVLVLLSVNTSFSQVDRYQSLLPVTIFPNNASKILNMKVARAFENYFRGATNIQWYPIDGNILVSFLLDTQRNRVLFRANGQIVYQVSFGSETSLPTHIRSTVKSQYYDHKIIHVYHVIQGKEKHLAHQPGRCHAIFNGKIRG